MPGTPVFDEDGLQNPYEDMTTAEFRERIQAEVAKRAEELERKKFFAMVRQLTIGPDDVLVFIAPQGADRHDWVGPAQQLKEELGIRGVVIAPWGTEAFTATTPEGFWDWVREGGER